MSDEIKQEIENSAVSPTWAKKPGRPAKTIKVRNDSKRPITLIVDRNTREIIAPTETKEFSKDFMEAVRSNPAAMTDFEDGSLVEV